MPELEAPVVVSRGRSRLGWIVSGLFSLFLVLDAMAHIMRPQPVIEAFAKLGVPLQDSIPLGALVLFCVLLYLTPRSSFVGAVLLTGYMGGAVAIHMRAQDAAFSMLFPVIIGVGLWAGIALRKPMLTRMFAGSI